MRPLLVIPALSFIGLLACSCGGGNAAATSTSRPSAAAPVQPSSDCAPMPCTLEDLRAACPTGRVIDVRIETAGKPAVRARTTFTRVDAAAAEMEDVALSDEGAPLGPPQRSTVRWEELYKHGCFPADKTVVDHESITVPAGVFDCARYVVTGSDGTVKTMWFSTKLPGPPVKMTVRKGADTVMTMTMLPGSG